LKIVEIRGRAFLVRVPDHANQSDLAGLLDLRSQGFNVEQLAAMPETDFEAEILENEVVLAHVAEGHVYHFPILTNGTVSLHGSRIEPNLLAKREAQRYVFDAHNAARAAFGRSQVQGHITSRNRNVKCLLLKT
jgi:hypothetical protein